MKLSTIKQNINLIRFRKLSVAAAVIGFLSAFLALVLKRMTEHYESVLFGAAANSTFFMLLFPAIGFSIIYILRQYLFKKKENKGITEIFESTQSKKKNLPMYKVPSHFINGMLTVAFGGSTGIEVSTVVASATIGSVAQQKENLFRKYKTELISAGVAAGITALFSSPVAGILFALEVITRKMSRAFIVATMISVTIASILLIVLNEQPMFAMSVGTWHYKAFPYFLVLGVLAGMNSVYLTRCVLFIKAKFAAIGKHYYKIILGATLLSIAMIAFPQLYGDGYHAMREILEHPDYAISVPAILTLGALLLLKPVVTSLTLASGGDGGVFAPSLFTGAFLGLLTALGLNTFFGAGVMPVNFIIIGMAAMLSASIHAPFTALFLVCGITGNYELFFPILAACLVSKYTAKMIFPFTVYTFSAKAN